MRGKANQSIRRIEMQDVFFESCFISGSGPERFFFVFKFFGMP